MSVIKAKQKIRVLPIFIFIATLTLSIKVNHVVDQVKNQTTKSISISQNRAFAEEKAAKETSELGEVLEKTDNINGSTSTTAAKTDNFTQSEILILQELAERREFLDLRSKEIDRKALQLKVAEEEIDKKLVQLQEYENRLKKLIFEYNEKEKEKINSLVKLYSTMKPKDAARIFNTLDTDILVSLLKEMKSSTASSILSQMKESKAKEITDELIGNNFFKNSEQSN